MKTKEEKEEEATAIVERKKEEVMVKEMVEKAEVGEEREEACRVGRVVQIAVVSILGGFIC